MKKLVNTIFTFANKLDKTEQAYVTKVQERLKKYESLEEQNRLATLPCACGDKLYEIVSVRAKKGNNVHYDIKEIIVQSIELSRYQNYVIDTEDNRINFKEFGNTVFLTLEAATARKNTLNAMNGLEEENQQNETVFSR